MTNEVLNVATNAVATTSGSSPFPSSADWVFLAICVAFAGLTFVLMYLGRPKDDSDKSDYEGEEY